MAFCLNVNYCLLPTLNTWHPFWVLACPGARSGGLGSAGAALGSAGQGLGKVLGAAGKPTLVSLGNKSLRPPPLPQP